MIAVSPSRDSWVKNALEDLDTLLIDHAHCERKAASTALRFIARYADRAAFVIPLSRLAREELVHFERVIAELKVRDVALRPLHSGGYATALLAATENPRDELLACALIEARSHERFIRLIEAVPDARLRSLYSELSDAEARHGDLYLDLARELDPAIDVALIRLTKAEAEIIARPNQPLRMHSGG